MLDFEKSDATPVSSSSPIVIEIISSMSEKPAAPSRVAWCKPAIGMNARRVGPATTPASASSVPPTTLAAAS